MAPNIMSSSNIAIVQGKSSDTKTTIHASSDGVNDEVASLVSAESGDDDRSSESSRHSESVSGKKTGSDQDSENKLDIAKKESVAVLRLRLLVFLVLLLAAIGVSVLVYFITSKAQDEEYKSQYDGASKKLIEAFLGIVQTNLGAVSSLGVAAIAHGVDHARKWPFVTLSSFQQRAATARSLSKALYVHINPYVTQDQRYEWEKFVVGNESKWIDEGLDYQDSVGLFHFIGDVELQAMPYGCGDIMSAIQKNESYPICYYSDEVRLDDPGPAPYMPVWQTSPIFSNASAVNYNSLRSILPGADLLSFQSDTVVISQFFVGEPGNISSSNPASSLFALMLSTRYQRMVPYAGDPLSKVFFPIFDSFRDDRKAAAILVTWIHWASYFEDILPSTLKGIYIVLNDGCGAAYTYQVNGENVIPIGGGDLHNSGFDSMKISVSYDSIFSIADGTKSGLPLNKDYCQVSLDIYPSKVFHDNYLTSTPLVITFCVAIIFVFTACMFLFYDRLVERRQALVMKKAEQTSKIVTSLFPSNVADRLMNGGAGNDGAGKGGFPNYAHNSRLKGFLKGTAEDDAAEAPIADLFVSCSVLFADIAGFTAWSSSREPAQVFILLQTVYQAFDVIAKRRRVFKVETIGDSYVAVTGLPEEQPNHAVIMARFAGECLTKMNELTAELESTLGPDTADLTMRFGIHSGPVTAGVLRGERARFQLFGDTVNTAARMESTGTKNRIQVSKSTADCLVAAGKEHWVRPRADLVQAKGKGSLQTYWLSPNAKKGTSITESEGSGASEGHIQAPEPAVNVVAVDVTTDLVRRTMKKDRLVDWIVELLQDCVKKVIAQNKHVSGTSEPYYAHEVHNMPLDEVAEVIILPRFNFDKFAGAEDYRNVTLSQDIINELREYVSTIAAMYNDNPFHNFEHACHVTMATSKFLKRIVSPDIVIEQGKNADIASKLHDYTHGINSDPLTVLAILVSALIHDTDHRGVSNMQLIVEQPNMAKMYSQKSVAEQNSLDIAWDLLMDNQFDRLRSRLFASVNDLKRFRQVLVNVVLATDIFDKELNQLRKNRWDKAFNEGCLSDEENNDLRGTIVIEHIIQASDVAHTMQHWHIYRKWNERLFEEMYTAFKKGRMGKNPTEFWYQGELGFFDNYIIPLAKKLKDCNVFGVSSDECLNYAMQNRSEWADRGQEIVEGMVQKLAQRFPEPEAVISSSTDFVPARLEC